MDKHEQLNKYLDLISYVEICMIRASVNKGECKVSKRSSYELEPIRKYLRKRLHKNIFNGIRTIYVGTCGDLMGTNKQPEVIKDDSNDLNELYNRINKR